MSPTICTTCGTEIREGAGRYITPDGIFCQACGLPFPLGPEVRVTITIVDPEGRLDRYTNKDRR